MIWLNPGMSKWRGRFAVIFLVLGTLLLPVGVVGHWGHRTFNDTNRFVQTVAPLASVPEVQDGIADTITDSLITVEGASAQVEEWFPRAPEGLVNTVSEAVVSRVNAIVRELAGTPQFATAWGLANGNVQKAFIAVLNNDPPDSLSVQDGNLVLNLDVLRENVRQRVEAEGISLPQVQSERIPATVVLASDVQVQQIRGIYQFTSPILAWFWILPVALLVLSVLLYPNKPRAVRRVGFGVLLGAAIIAAFLMLGVGFLTPALQNTAFAAAQQPIWNTLTAYLAQAAWITAGVGVVLVGLGAWFGRGRTETVVVEEVVTEKVTVE